MLESGAYVAACDPAATHHVKAALPHSERLRFVDDPYDALRGADALCVVTEWQAFGDPDFARMRSLMRHFAIFDGRNVYKPVHFKNYPEASYVSIGRSSVSPTAAPP